MTKQEIVDMLIFVATGFTIASGILGVLLLINHPLYNNILYHYSDGLTWYVFFILFPLLAGFSFFLWFRNKQVPKSIKNALWTLFVLQFVFIAIVPIINYNYWGYAFKRPTVFKEILAANKVLTCSKVSNIDSTGITSLSVIADTTKQMDNLYGRKDFYYGTTDRIFMVFQDRASINGHLYNVPEIYNSQEQKISKDILQTIYKQILESGSVDKGEEKWDTSIQLNGIVTEFISTENKKYIFAGLHGGQVSNDHYPYYEFLFIEKNLTYELIKMQRFYTDTAGIEGIEYANISPLFSLLFTLFGIFAVIISEIKNRVFKPKEGINKIL